MHQHSIASAQFMHLALQRHRVWASGSRVLTALGVSDTSADLSMTGCARNVQDAAKTLGVLSKIRACIIT